MGLFSNNKKLCPICGNPTPRLLATKVENMPICKACDKKVDLPVGTVDKMTLEEFQQYMAYYDENEPLRRQFQRTYLYAFGLFSGDLVVDDTHRLLRLKQNDDALVLKGSDIRSFRICEDGFVLYESGSGALLCHNSKVPDAARSQKAAISRFYQEKQERQRMQYMAELHETLHSDHDHDKDRDAERRLPPEPTFEAAAPVKQFTVEVRLNHPYWKKFQGEVDAPGYDRHQPDVEDYLKEYRAKSGELLELAKHLMRLIDPAAKERWDGAATEKNAAAKPAAAPVDVVTEIQRYKGLLDAGIITEEKFTAKKRQLMGI